MGSRWINVSADREYVCVDKTAGAAIWLETTSQGVTDASFLTLAAHANLTNERVFTPGTALSAVDGGAGGAYTLSHAQVATGDLHTEYARLAGRAGGQTLIGGTGSAENLIVESTSHSTKGYIHLREENIRIGRGGSQVDLLDNGGTQILSWLTVSKQGVLRGTSGWIVNQRLEVQGLGIRLTNSSAGNRALFGGVDKTLILGSVAGTGGVQSGTFITVHNIRLRDETTSGVGGIYGSVLAITPANSSDVAAVTVTVHGDLRVNGGDILGPDGLSRLTLASAHPFVTSNGTWLVRSPTPQASNQRTVEIDWNNSTIPGGSPTLLHLNQGASLTANASTLSALAVAGAIDTAGFNIDNLRGLSFTPVVSNNSVTTTTITNFAPLHISAEISNANPVSVTTWRMLNLDTLLSGSGAKTVTTFQGIDVPAGPTTGTVTATTSMGMRIRNIGSSVSGTDLIGIDINALGQAGYSTSTALRIASPINATTLRSIRVTGTAPSIHQPALLIGADAAPATSAILELQSTMGALLLPRMTTTERDALTAVNGMVIYNATDNVVQARENGVWVDL